MRVTLNNAVVDVTEVKLGRDGIVKVKINGEGRNIAKICNSMPPQLFSVRHEGLCGNYECHVQHMQVHECVHAKKKYIRVFADITLC